MLTPSSLAEMIISGIEMPKIGVRGLGVVTVTDAEDVVEVGKGDVVEVGKDAQGALVVEIVKSEKIGMKLEAPREKKVKKERGVAVVPEIGNAADVVDPENGEEVDPEIVKGADAVGAEIVKIVTGLGIVETVIERNVRKEEMNVEERMSRRKGMGKCRGRAI